MSSAQQHRALVLLGSNIDRERNIPLAIQRLATHPELRLLAVSRVYESAAIGKSMGVSTTQPRFSNCAALLETALTPQELRSRLRGLEAEAGRVRSADKYAPRPIDLDIVLFDDLVENVDGSPVPDPDLLRFAHVAVPCGEIAPDWQHPQTGQTLKVISNGVDSRSLQPINEHARTHIGAHPSV